MSSGAAHRRSVPALLAAAAILCVSGVVAAVFVGTSGGPAVRSPAISVDGQNRLSVAWLGDTLFGDRAQPMLDQFGPGWAAANLPALEADVVVVNLEGPITERTEPWDRSQRWSYQSRPYAAGALAGLGVDVAVLANNHAFDRGPGGLTDTITNLRAARIHPIGAGASSAEAELPLLVKSGVGTLAVVSFAEGPHRRSAGPDRAGVSQLTRQNLSSGIELARRAGARWVAAAVHWGRNYDAVDARQRRWAAALADAGYDLVVGTGPHIAQPIETIGPTTVAYSIGNYIFGTPGRFRSRGVPGRGLVLTSHFKSEESMELSIRCIVTDNEIVNFQPRPCNDEESRETLSALHPALSIEAGSGRMVVPLAQHDGSAGSPRRRQTA